MSTIHDIFKQIKNEPPDYSIPANLYGPPYVKCLRKIKKVFRSLIPSEYENDDDYYIEEYYDTDEVEEMWRQACIGDKNV